MKVKMGCYLGGSARNSHSITLSCNRYSQSTYYRPETILGDGNTAVQRTESQPSRNLHNSQETSELKNQTSTMMPDMSLQRNEERDEVYFHMDAFLCISVHPAERPLQMSVMPEQFAVLGVHFVYFCSIPILFTEFEVCDS